MCVAFNETAIIELQTTKSQENANVYTCNTFFTDETSLWWMSKGQARPNTGFIVKEELWAKSGRVCVGLTEGPWNISLDLPWPHVFGGDNHELQPILK